MANCIFFLMCYFSNSFFCFVLKLQTVDALFLKSPFFPPCPSRYVCRRINKRPSFMSDQASPCCNARRLKLISDWTEHFNCCGTFQKHFCQISEMFPCEVLSIFFLICVTKAPGFGYWGNKNRCSLSCTPVNGSISNTFSINATPCL